MVPAPRDPLSNGGLRKSLAAHIEQGLLLIDRVREIEDQDQFHVWRGGRNLWLWDAAEAVGALHGERAGQAFRKATSLTAGPASTWRAALPGEVARVRVALRLLRGLR
jgi:hypothetical protein